MQYGHMPIADRDPAFHQNALGQALGTYQRTQEYRPASHSPPQPPAHSPLTFAVQGPAAGSPALKRKQPDNALAHTLKRRRDTAQDDPDGYDLDSGAQGAKHWTDDEKSRLFNWLMGPGQEDHWNALRATKNSCLRECAIEVFGGKKTYQALKGCYERNFNLFKQIYAFESAHGQTTGATALATLSEADRLREYERRLALVRKGSDVGSITARTIDHWHRVGWYDLFYRRWHGDPATTRPIQAQQGRTSLAAGGGTSGTGGGGTIDDDDDDNTGSALDSFHDASTGITNNTNNATANGSSSASAMNGLQQQHMQHDRQQQPVNYINPQELRDTSSGGGSASASLRGPPHQAQQSQPQPQAHPHGHTPGLGIHIDPNATAHAGPSGGVGTTGLAPGVPGGAAPLLNLALTSDLVSKCIQYLDLQARVAQEKLAYLKRRESREQAEFNSRKDVERKGKSEKALELINNPNVDPSLKQAATEYLRKQFLQDL